MAQDLSEKLTHTINPATIRIKNIGSTATPTELTPPPATVYTPQQPKTDPPAESEPTTTIAPVPQPQPEKESTAILSVKPLSEWHGSSTFFDGFYRTTPKSELDNANWSDVCKWLCPPKPYILSNKRDGNYFIPCLLKEAPLVGRTLEIAVKMGMPTVGKMRSKHHPTDASFGAFDIDDFPEQGYLAALENIKNDGISYVAFTTFSHGDPDKPGMRVRMSIAFDRPVTPEEYTLAWHGVDQKYFGGQLYKADPSGARLYQQQGIWSCHPSRIRHARSWRHDAGVASADFLIQLGRTAIPAIVASSVQIDHADEDAPTAIYPVSIIIDLVKCLDPDLLYPEWFLVIAAIFNITHGSHEGLEIADAWSSGGSKYKGFRDVQRYWNTVRHDHPRPVKIGTLINMAKEAGADVTAILQDDAFEVCESKEESSDDSNA